MVRLDTKNVVTNSLMLKRNELLIPAYISSVFDVNESENSWNLSRVFSSKEYSEYKKIPVFKRKKSFYLGRLVAKTAVAQILDEFDLTQIQIENGIFNFPLVNHSSSELPEISISHAGDLAVAISFPRTHPMGVDIEKINVSRMSVLTSQLTQAEMDAVDQSGLKPEIAVYMLWTMKEALSKVLKTGLTADFHCLEVSDLRWSNKTTAMFKNFHQYQVSTWFQNDYVISIVLPKKTQIDFEPKIVFEEME